MLQLLFLILFPQSKVNKVALKYNLKFHLFLINFLIFILQPFYGILFLAIQLVSKLVFDFKIEKSDLESDILYNIKTSCSPSH